MKKQVRGAAALRGVVCACAVLGGCAVTEGDELGATTQEIIGGTAATAATMRREIGRWGGCTATLIAPQWVLTAGHCNEWQDLVRIQPAGAVSFQTTTNGSTWATSAPGAVATDRAMFLGSITEFDANDLRLVRLTAPVPTSVAVPTSIATAAPTSGTVTTWGQGISNLATGTGFGVMRFRESAAGAVTAFLGGGDSGGPRVVGARAANGPVFQVNAGVSGVDVFADPVARRSEILGIIAEWGAYPGTDIDSFAWCAGADDQRLWGDVDADGDPDAICHNRVTGSRSVAENHRRLIRSVAGTSTTFCGGSGKTLLTGDFNRDGRTDLLCHGGGSIAIDLAGTAAASRYGAADIIVNTSLCSHATGRLHTGDFDADGRTDILCHDIGTGQMWIDFAASSGAPFNGIPDWDPNTASRWCGGSSKRLYVGEVDGDGATDLFCVDTATGAVTLQYSDRNRTPFAGGTNDDQANGGLPGASCTTNANCAEGQRCEVGVCRERLCVGAGSLRVVDVTGDGRSDLVCEYPGGRSFALRTFAGSPDGVPANAISDAAYYYTSALARFRPRTAHAASRPSNRW